MLVALLLAAALAWEPRAAAPQPRTEVAAAAVGGRIAIAGGYAADGSSSRRVDRYSPSSDLWSRLPDLPFGVNHAAAANLGGRLVVVGGYAAPGRAVRSAVRLGPSGWVALPPMPSRRGAAGAAVLGGRLYVVGGVGPSGLARGALEYEPRAGRWRFVVAPTPREHLAVVAAGGRLWAIGGRTAGLDTNLDLVESWKPGEPRWRLGPPLPEARGGTGVAAVGDTIVSIGGEAPSGTIASVYALGVGDNHWRRLPDLPTPRHGLGVAAVGRTVYALAGGPEPGLHVSAANEALEVPGLAPADGDGLMALIGALLLAIFVLPHPWGLVAVTVGTAIEVAESLFWVRWSRRRRIQVGAETLIGAEAEVRSRDLVFVNGELWRAHGAEHLEPGARVRILALHGLTLVVEPVH